jgi:hypothetical protein
LGTPAKSAMDVNSTYTQKLLKTDKAQWLARRIQTYDRTDYEFASLALS